MHCLISSVVGGAEVRPGEHHTKNAFLHKHALTGCTTHAYSFKRLALPRLPQHLPFSPDLMRVTHAHPLNPEALAFVPFEIVLVRVRVRVLSVIVSLRCCRST